MAAPEFVETTITFCPSRYRGFRMPGGYSKYQPPPDDGVNDRSFTCKVHNARLLDPAPTLDSHGFQLVEAPTELDLQDTDQVTGAFYAECRALIKRVTGCAAVRDGRHEYRRSPGLPTPNGSGGGFAGGIHADMSCAIELNWQPGDDERHFQSLNVWRSAEPEAEIEMMPLALCAMDSVDPKDIVYGDGQNTSDIRMYMKAVYGQEEDKAGRVRRWLDGITSVYPDGSASDWFQGPIEGYKPPEHAAL